MEDHLVGLQLFGKKKILQRINEKEEDSAVHLIKSLLSAAWPWRNERKKIY